MRKKSGFVFVIAAIALFGIWVWRNVSVGPALLPPPADVSELLNETDFPFVMPPGVRIGIFARGLEGPRVLAFDAQGTLLVSITRENRVVALPDRNRDGKADEVVPILTDLNRPHGLLVRCARACTLFVAESHAIAAYRYDPALLQATGRRELVSLPDGGNHYTRTIGLTRTAAGERLLVSIGSSCNVCVEGDGRRAKLFSMNVDGTDVKEYARGLRNTVFFISHPETALVWGTDMGRDLIGDDIPPDEINILEEGKDYGWPLCYGKNVLDASFHRDRHVHVRAHCTEPYETSSFIDIPAHSAPLGLAFVPKGADWPEEYKGDLLVAYHGSWNRSVPTGYKVVRMKFDANGAYEGVEDFMTGWLTQANDALGLGRAGAALGRPVDLKFGSDGALYISDDKAGVIYRVSPR